MPKTERTNPAAKSTRKGAPVPADPTAADPGSPEVLAAALTAAATVVLDTSVLMADPQAYRSFTDADVVIPLTVIDELDRNKTRLDEAGRNARTVLRELEDLRLGHGGDIATAVALPAGGTLRIEPNGLRLEELTAHHLDPREADHRILAATLGLRGDGRPQVRLVSNDAALRIKAAVLGLDAAEHRQVFGEGARGRRTPAGWVEVAVSAALVDALHGAAPVDLDTLDDYDRAAVAAVRNNQFVVAQAGPKHTALARRVGDSLCRVTSANQRGGTWGLKSKSKEQQFALDLLMDANLPLVALQGAAGTGKTMLAVAAALHQTFEMNRYSRMTILRPVIAVGKQELGYLPGDLEEKLGPWFETVVDTMVALSGTKQTHRECRSQLDAWVDEGRLTLEAVTFLRGRSLSSTILVADEVQNFEPATCRTIVTRLGHGSKGVLIGDTSQIDSPWTSEHSNGLSAVIRAFEGEPEFGHVTLTKGERSRIADLAADRL